MEPKFVKVRVKTAAKNESLREIAPDHLQISVREKPERNAANTRVLELVALHLKLPASKIRMIKGHHRPSKTLQIS